MHYSTRQGTSCNGKATYETIGEVDLAVRNLCKKTRAAKRQYVRPYHCNVCQGWHVTGFTSDAERANPIKKKGGPRNDARDDRKRKRRARKCYQRIVRMLTDEPAPA